MPSTVTFTTRRSDVDVSVLGKVVGGDGNAAIATVMIDPAMLDDIIHMII